MLTPEKARQFRKDQRKAEKQKKDFSSLVLCNNSFSDYFYRKSLGIERS